MHCTHFSFGLPELHESEVYSRFYKFFFSNSDHVAFRLFLSFVYLRIVLRSFLFRVSVHKRFLFLLSLCISFRGEAFGKSVLIASGANSSSFIRSAYRTVVGASGVSLSMIVTLISTPPNNVAIVLDHVLELNLQKYSLTRCSKVLHNDQYFIRKGQIEH